MGLNRVGTHLKAPMAVLLVLIGHSKGARQAGRECRGWWGTGKQMWWWWWENSCDKWHGIITLVTGGVSNARHTRKYENTWCVASHMMCRTPHLCVCVSSCISSDLSSSLEGFSSCVLSMARQADWKALPIFLTKATKQYVWGSQGKKCITILNSRKWAKTPAI